MKFSYREIERIIGHTPYNCFADIDMVAKRNGVDVCCMDFEFAWFFYTNSLRYKLKSKWLTGDECLSKTFNRKEFLSKLINNRIMFGKNN